MDRPISSVTSQEKSYYNEKKSEEFKSLAPPKPNLQSMQLNTNKAGMKGIDTLKINEIIQKASEGSKFFLHKQKCQEKIDAKIAQMKSLIDKFSEDQIEKAEHEMTVLSHELESNNDFARTIVHIDMDMFYAAVEMRDDPSLRDKPMAVGGMNMLSTSNYAARKFGVRAAMPGFIGKKLCPELIIVPTNFDKYKKVSAQIQEIFEEYDPNFSPMSLDEAYLDITNYLIHHSDEYQHEEVEFGKSLAEVIVEEIRKKVQEKTQLTASAGIAVNTLLAKVCSDMNKPNGQFYLPPNKEDVDKFIENLPIRKISGIGNVTEQQLKGIGIVTCSDLFKKRGLLKLLFSETSYLHFLRISLGIGSTEISPSSERERKSISTETTFSGTADKKVLLDLVTELCNDLKADMIKRNLYGKVFTLKMKTSQFEVRTRAQSLFEPTQDESIMISVGHKLLINEIENETKNRPLTLRLLGVRMSNLCDKSDLDPMKQTTITELFNKSNVYNKESKAKSQYEELFIENIDNYEEDTTDELTWSETINATRSNPNDSDDIQLLQANTNSEPKTSELEKTFEEFTCPVCSNKSFSHMDDLNSHIDLCLNRDLVKELVKESNTPICKPNNGAEFSASGSKITPVNHSQKRKSNSRLTTPKRYKSDKQSGPSQTLHKYLGLK